MSQTLLEKIQSCSNFVKLKDTKLYGCDEFEIIKTYQETIETIVESSKQKRRITNFSCILPRLYNTFLTKIECNDKSVDLYIDSNFCKILEGKGIINTNVFLRPLYNTVGISTSIPTTLTVTYTEVKNIPKNFDTLITSKSSFALVPKYIYFKTKNAINSFTIKYNKIFDIDQDWGTELCYNFFGFSSFLTKHKNLNIPDNPNYTDLLNAYKEQGRSEKIILEQSEKTFNLDDINEMWGVIFDKEREGNEVAIPLNLSIDINNPEFPIYFYRWNCLSRFEYYEQVIFPDNDSGGFLDEQINYFESYKKLSYKNGSLGFL